MRLCRGVLRRERRSGWAASVAVARPSSALALLRTKPCALAARASQRLRRAKTTGQTSWSGRGCHWLGRHGPSTWHACFACQCTCTTALATVASSCSVCAACLLSKESIQDSADGNRCKGNQRFAEHFREVSARGRWAVNGCAQPTERKKWTSAAIRRSLPFLPLYT